MAQMTLHTSVGDWVARHPQTSRVFESLQIDYCCGGGKPLDQACRERQLDPQQVFAKLEQSVIGCEDERTEDWLQRPAQRDLRSHRTNASRVPAP